jgi:hypothetical protein
VLLTCAPSNGDVELIDLYSIVRLHVTVGNADVNEDDNSRNVFSG